MCLVMVSIEISPKEMTALGGNLQAFKLYISETAKKSFWEKVIIFPPQSTRDMPKKNMPQYFCVWICVHEKERERERDGQTDHI